MATLADLVNEYAATHKLSAQSTVMEFDNRHHTSCEHYGSLDFAKCDCLTVPKFEAVGVGAKVHEVYNPKTGEVAYILEALR
jgi:hypothetical protein